MTALDADIVERFRRPITTTWNNIAPDLMAGYEGCGEEMDNDAAIEGCIDANQLWLSGGDREADQLISQLSQEHGYITVLKFLSQHFCLVQQQSR